MDNNMEYTEKPLGYWEEKSYMLAVVNELNEALYGEIVNRVEAIDGIVVTATRDLTEEQAGGIRFTYQGEDFEVGYYPTSFNMPKSYTKGPYYIPESEIAKIANAKQALVVYMAFGKNPKESFKLQLKLVSAMVPDMLALVDESAEKMMPIKWVKMAIESSVTPSANDLYTLQAIMGENHDVWIHTHGLCRCGLHEVEILQSDDKHYNAHYNLISTYASYLLDNKGSFESAWNGAHLGYFINNMPIVATSISWTKALKEFPNLNLGNIYDREHEHNSKTNVMFMYSSEQDEFEKRLTRITDFNDLWNNNPLFLISNEETKIRTIIAKERFYLLKKAAENKENEVLIKIAMPVNNSDKFEHIYFKLISFEGDKFRAVLTQEAYGDIGMHTGDEGVFTVDNVSDWYIGTPSRYITPTMAYLLVD